MITMNTTEIPRSMTGGIDLTSLLKNSFVYFLFSGNEVVYVGQSTTVGSRLSAHSKDKEFDRASGIIVEPYRRLAVALNSKTKLLHISSAIYWLANPV
jgi:predicted GIY-YIG superfamily endonuclease